MRRQIFVLLLIAVAIISGYGLLSNRLQSQDISFSGYLSGFIAQAITPPKDSLIRVNLYSGTITLFERGTLYKQAMISASGNPTDNTATPTGSFRILSKELRHISSLSGVTMPYSLRFFGGYYFHAIPSTPDGALITTRYSAGCIRLPDGLIQEVYNWARIGTRVEIYRARLARADNAPAVYLLTEDGHRQPIASERAFLSRGYKWSDVATIPSAELASMPIGGMIQ